MYIIKAYVHNTRGAIIGSPRDTIVATAIIKTHDTSAFMSLRDQPLANVPDHCDVKVETFVNIRGQQFPARSGILGSLIKDLMKVHQELHIAERETRRKPGNGAVHHIHEDNSEA